MTTTLTEPTPIHAMRDDLGMCNILLTALGGDGANMAAKLIFKAGCTFWNLDGGYDAKYGSEKKGTATDVSIRFCESGTPVRQVGPTSRPHFLVVFHADLMGPLSLTAGLYPQGVCIINSDQPPESFQGRFFQSGVTVITVDATRIAFECHSRLNMPMAAVLCHELGFNDQVMKKLIADTWPRAVESNLSAFDRALGESKRAQYDGTAAPPTAPPSSRHSAVGYRNMLNGGAIDALTHSTVGRDNRIAGRGRIPAFEPEKCTNCGICLTVCSDPGGLMWRQGRMTGIDDRFCKGCMRCVEVCPETKKGRALTFFE